MRDISKMVGKILKGMDHRKMETESIAALFRFCYKGEQKKWW
jgi:hypothetical protein